MLRITDLHVWYGGIHAVKGISLNIPKGQIVTLIGANGAGKSSTVRAITGLVKQVSGEINYKRPNGENIKLLSNTMVMLPEDIVKVGIAMSPEGRRILPHLTIEENLQLGAYIRNDKEGILKDMDWVYTLFPRLKERAWQKGGTLSGGEQQMLAVGRALMSNPDLLILDEPSLGLAPILVRELFNTICQINAMGKTILLIEQNAFAALHIAHRAYILEVGSIVLEGEGKKLLTDPKVKSAYLGG
ncbi:ABC transporter ATP-binding protein [Desulfovibrio litoralis]|uniref:Amino acid/amide ABC transporter ATP-binding protein 2, HAAT family n=1 Tax=Desulfovibrio litoralis DSM 11393 TaxID=1121455 RepID=A0A1M7TFU1_9BACT|nr:ABC transporter ATP-binding protein [Desulfovibrio litoralis]SHN69488.1 amino acid/amide ABC transporter ATP-binding protein 2, HAAT family [Desulfovibrio litoralis DSM 11393]